MWLTTKVIRETPDFKLCIGTEDLQFIYVLDGEIEVKILDALGKKHGYRQENTDRKRNDFSFVRAD